MVRLLSLLFLLLVSHSCIMHAPYERPDVDIPESWRLETDEALTLCNFRWWEQFHDPVLDELILEALANNYDLKVAIARVWEFWANYIIVRSPLFPQVYGNASANRFQQSLAASPVLPGMNRIYNMYEVYGNVTYEVDIWGQTVSATEAALDELLAQVNARQTFVQTLVSEVATAYIILRQYDAQLLISKQTYESRIESYELAKARWLGGLTSELEVKQAESEMESALIEVKQLEILQQQQENRVSFLIGRNPGPIPRGATLDTLEQPPSIPAGLPADLLQQRPDIMGAEAQLAAANANIGAARAQFFPQITLTGMYGNESIELHKLFTSPAVAWQYGVNLLQPIFTGGKLSAQLDQAQALTVEAMYTYLSTILRAFQEVDDALIFHQISLELVVIQKKQVEVLKEYLHLAKLQYDNGQTDYLNVLDAERRLFEAQLNYANAQSNSFVSVVSLYKALGGGWIIDADCIALDTSEIECIE